MFFLVAYRIKNLVMDNLVSPWKWMFNPNATGTSLYYNREIH